VSTPKPPALQAGSPCPRGCTVGYPGHEDPELLTANIDGELSCPTCWECFGIVAPVSSSPTTRED
jgi:hypothetical protein